MIGSFKIQGNALAPATPVTHEAALDGGGGAMVVVKAKRRAADSWCRHVDLCQPSLGATHEMHDGSARVGLKGPERCKEREDR
jgi:hypothetical protein